MLTSKVIRRAILSIVIAAGVGLAAGMFGAEPQAGNKPDAGNSPPATHTKTGSGTLVVTGPVTITDAPTSSSGTNTYSGTTTFSGTIQDGSGNAGLTLTKTGGGTVSISSDSNLGGGTWTPRGGEFNLSGGPGPAPAPAVHGKAFYVITEGAGMGDNVRKFPLSGDETVLDAISQVGGLSQLSSRKLWVARPSAADPKRNDPARRLGSDYPARDQRHELSAPARRPRLHRRRQSRRAQQQDRQGDFSRGARAGRDRTGRIHPPRTPARALTYGLGCGLGATYHKNAQNHCWKGVNSWSKASRFVGPCFRS